jgi:hypothetical protein
MDDSIRTPPGIDPVTGFDKCVHKKSALLYGIPDLTPLIGSSGTRRKILLTDLKSLLHKIR